MDKYEYKLKLEQLKNLVEEKDYKTAAEIADTINWRKVKSAATLCMVGEIYDRNKQYENSRDILLMAYDRATVGRNIIYRLALVNLKMGKIEEAKEYYDEFLEVAPYDNLKYVLRYQIARIEGASLEQQIVILEEFKSREYTEEWAFELAYLYHRAGNSERCVEVCDELVLWFGDGKCVEKALELKMLYQPLDKYQEEKYREFKRHQEGEVEVDSTEMMESGEIIQDTVKLPDLAAPSGRFNTLNLQEELAKGMQQIMEADSKETVSDTMDNIKKIVEEIPYLQISQEEEPEEEEERYGHIETDEEIDDFLQTDFQEMLAEDWDGQISFAVPGGEWRESQISGQMNIDDVLINWEKTKHAAEMAMAMAQQRKLESAKVRALQEAEELMARLNQIIPKLNAGVTPQELLAERYLQNGEEEYGAAPGEEGYYNPEEAEGYYAQEGYYAVEGQEGEEGYYKQEEEGSEGYYSQEEGEPESYYSQEGQEGQEGYYGAEVQEGEEGYYGAEMQEGEEGYYGAEMQEGQEGAEGYYGAEMQEGEEGYYGAEMQEGQEGYYGAEVQEGEEGYYSQGEGEPEGYYSQEEGNPEGYYNVEGTEGYYNMEELEVTQEELDALPEDPLARPEGWYGDSTEERGSLPEMLEEEPQAFSGKLAEGSGSLPEASMENVGDLPEAVQEGDGQPGVFVEGAGKLPAAILEEPEAAWGDTKELPKISLRDTERTPQERKGLPEASVQGEEDSQGEAEGLPEASAQGEPNSQGGMEGLPEASAQGGPNSGEEKKAFPEASAQGDPNSGEAIEAFPEAAMGYPKAPPGDSMEGVRGLPEVPSEGAEVPKGGQEARPEVPGAQPKARLGTPMEGAKAPQKAPQKTGRLPRRPFLKPKGTPEAEQEIPPLEYAKEEPKPKKKDAESYLESAFRAARASREEKNHIPTVKMEPVHVDGGKKGGNVAPGRKASEQDLPIPEISMDLEEGMAIPELGIGMEEQPLRKLTEEQKEIFSYFVPVTGMEQQLCQVLEGVLHRRGKDNTSSSGNILVMGGRGSGKTVLATDIIKAVHRDGEHPPKVGKIMGESLNQKDLSQLLKKIAGGYLIIEKAGEMSQETITRLSLLMEQNTEGLLFILEDARKEIEKVLSQDVNFAKKFTERIKIPVFTSDELVEFAKAYAREQECEIDDMGILALYNRISNIQKLDEATTLTEVKEIVDLAISSAERGGLKKLFGGKKFSPEGYLYLREKDFEE